jgi:hypothetical protein
MIADWWSWRMQGTNEIRRVPREWSRKKDFVSARQEQMQAES